MLAERETNDRLIAHFLADRVGATFDGRISGVTRAGLFVKLNETGADGFVPARTIGEEYFRFEEAARTMVGSRSGETYRLGDPVTVKLVEAAPVAGALRFELALAGPSRHRAAADASSRRPRGARQAFELSRQETEGTMSDELGQRMTERMTGSERDQSFADSEPRDAATLMLIDRSDAANPKVLLGRRHAGHKFMPGKFVFPGGRIESADRAMPAATELHADALKKLMTRVAEPSAAYARGFPLAAVRETCEETGLMLGVKREPPPQVPGDIWADFARASIFPDLAHIHFIARAITPPQTAAALRHPLLHGGCEPHRSPHRRHRRAELGAG